VNRMTLWEFAACMDGIRVFHGGKPARARGEELTEDDLRDMGIEGFDD
jgi:hypothetical protein